MKKKWFKNKKFGIGWSPASWEGWTVTGFFLAIAILIVISFERGTTAVEVIGSLAVPILLLVAISFMTSQDEEGYSQSKIDTTIK